MPIGSVPNMYAKCGCVGKTVNLIIRNMWDHEICHFVVKCSQKTLHNPSYYGRSDGDCKQRECDLFGSPYDKLYRLINPPDRATNFHAVPG